MYQYPLLSLLARGVLDWTRGDTPGRESVVCSHDMLSVPNNSGEVLVGRTGVQKVVCYCRWSASANTNSHPGTMVHTHNALSISMRV